VSYFVDRNPKGFGLIQRKRRYADYLDPAARYERRPSAWIEPVGDWGEGAVMLVEIPTASEVNDNLVAFWRPAEPVRVGTEWHATYRLHWCSEAPAVATRQLASVVDTRVGAGSEGGRRRFVVEFGGGGTPPPETPLRVEAGTSRGQLHAVSAAFNPHSGNWRVSFELGPEGDEPIELRCRLMLEQRAVSETWMFQWTE
jgi:glucans biosynthesis protein